MTNYSIIKDGATYHNVSMKDLIDIVGENDAQDVASREILNQIKAASHQELLQYDWMYVRQLRTSLTDIPEPVPAQIAEHYEVVRQWVAQQEQAISNMTVEQLEAYTFIVPTL